MSDAPERIWAQPGDDQSIEARLSWETGNCTTTPEGGEYVEYVRADIAAGWRKVPAPDTPEEAETVERMIDAYEAAMDEGDGGYMLAALRAAFGPPA